MNIYFLLPLINSAITIVMKKYLKLGLFASLLSGFLLGVCFGLAGQTPYNPAQDSMFSKPYIDLDEWRDTPVRHRYVHGGFAGTGTRFSFYFPAKEQYQGRFFQYITPFPDWNCLQTAGSWSRLTGILKAKVLFLFPVKL